MAAGATTTYTQDLAAPLDQILSDGSSTYLYGQERLLAQQGSTATWYDADPLGSVRQTLSGSGTPSGSPIWYDPWGQVQSGTVPTFGFTGELQQGSDVYLRARWYNTTSGTFISKDPFAGFPTQPYSLHPYQYGYADPVRLTDPSGKCVGWLWGSAECQFIGWDNVQQGNLNYVDGGKVVVNGLGVTATVVACVGTAGTVCAAGAAGAAAVTSWANQALDNAGQPLAQAVTNVSGRQIVTEAALAAVSGPIGGAAARVTGAVTARTGMAAATRATLNGSVTGGISNGADQLLRNAVNGDPLLDGVPEACALGMAFGGPTGRISHSINQWWLRKYPAFYSAQGPEDVTRLLKNKGVPWPQGLKHGSVADMFGPGLYTFPSEKQAITYMNRLREKGAQNIRLVEHRIAAKDLAALRSIDFTTKTDEEFNAILDLGAEHGYERITRMTNKYEPEDYFSSDVYDLFRSRVK